MSNDGLSYQKADQRSVTKDIFYNQNSNSELIQANISTFAVEGRLRPGSG